MTISSTSARVFRATPARTVLGAVVIAAGFAALAFGGGCAVLLLGNGVLRRSVLDVIITVVIVAIALAGVALIAARITTRIVVDTGEVRVERFGRVLRRWDRGSSTFGSRAVRTGSNASASERHLVIMSAGGQHDQPLWQFDEEQFSSLVALLAPVRAPQPAAAQATGPAAAAAPTSGTFVLDRTPLVKVARRMIIVSIASLTVILVVAYVVLDLIASETPDLPRIPALVIPALVYLAVVALIVVRQILPVLRLPRVIQVSPSSLRIDDRDVQLGSLARVDLTPASYVAGARVLALVPADGSPTIRYALGGASLAAQQRHQLFPDYAAFVDTVIAAGTWRGPEFVRFLLG